MSGGGGLVTGGGGSTVDHGGINRTHSGLRRCFLFAIFCVLDCHRRLKCGVFWDMCTSIAFRSFWDFFAASRDLNGLIWQAHPDLKPSPTTSTIIKHIQSKSVIYCLILCQRYLSGKFLKDWNKSLEVKRLDTRIEHLVITLNQKTLTCFQK